METLEDVASVMRCRVGKLPTSYLGLPLGATFKSPRVWDAVEERFKKKISLWNDYYQKVLFCRSNYNGFKHL